LRLHKSDIKPAAQTTTPDTQDKPTLFVKKREVLPLSSRQLEELMKGVLGKGASFRFRCKGFSMSPFIKDGDVLTIAPLQGSSLSFGEVVVFSHPSTGKLIIHRVIKKKEGAYLTKGDNIPESDGFISKAHIFGRVTKVERNGVKSLIGLGPERFLIVFLTRWRLLPLLDPIWRFVRIMIRRRQGA
jgi:signal peptidase I